MPVVGSIIRKGVNVPFLCARTDNGSPLEIPREVFEELATAGCDGRRYRTVHRQFPSFIMNTVTEASNYGAAVSIRNNIDGLVNKLVSLSLTLDGSNYAWTDAHIDSVDARAVAGQVIAAGSSSSTAHVICSWQITLTDFALVTKS